MRTIKTLFVLFGLISFQFVTSQEKTTERHKVTVIGKENQINKSTSEKKAITLQAIPIDSTSEVEDKPKIAVFLDSINSSRVNNRRKKVSLTTRPIDKEVPEVQKSILTEVNHLENKMENRVELKATLVPFED